MIDPFLQQAFNGRSNATGLVTLKAGATSTTVNPTDATNPGAQNVAPSSRIFLFPMTANAGLAGAPAPTLTVAKQVFTASGTYTPSAGMVYAIIECVGCGGGGGGVTGVAGDVFGAGGGGGGSYSRLLASAATIGASQTVTVGSAGSGGAAGSHSGSAGGDVSVGTLCVGKGGAGGGFTTSGTFPISGAGGVAGTGDVTSPGEAGAPGSVFTNATSFVSGGAGGRSYFGAGGVCPIATTGAVANGVAASNYGAGGSGGAAQNVNSNASGGNGSAGIVIITEFCLAAAAVAPPFISSIGNQTFTVSHANNSQTDRTFFYVAFYPPVG